MIGTLRKEVERLKRAIEQGKVKKKKRLENEVARLEGAKRQQVEDKQRTGVLEKAYEASLEEKRVLVDANGEL